MIMHSGVRGLSRCHSNCVIKVHRSCLLNYSGYMDVDIYLSYESIFGKNDLSLDSVVTEIGQYDVKNLIYVLIGLLNNYEAYWGVVPGHNISMTRALFKGDMQLLLKVMRKLHEVSAAHNGAIVEIANRRNLLVLMKLIFLYASSNGQGKKFDVSQTPDVGRWLLKLNSLMEQYDRRVETQILIPKSTAEEMFLPSYIRFSIRQLFFNAMGREHSLYILIRYIDIFELIEKKHNVNLDSVFKDVTGVSLTEYLDLNLVISMYWHNYNPTFNSLEETTLWPSEDFKALKFSEEVYTYLRSALSIDCREFSQVIKRRQAKLGDDPKIEMYDFFPFLQKPLSHHDKGGIKCLSFPFYTYSAVENVYFSLKDSDAIGKTIIKGEKIDKFAIWWGEAFQEYCDSLLTSMFDTYLTEEQVNSQYGELDVDGILISDDYLLVFETKSSRWSDKAIIYNNQAQIEESLKVLFTDKGLKQIYDKLPFLRSIKEWEKYKIVPVLLTGEVVPHDKFTRRYYDDLMKKAVECFQENEYVLPYITLDINDLMLLKEFSREQGGKAAAQILVDFSSSLRKKDQREFRASATPFINFLTTHVKMPTNDDFAARVTLRYDEMIMRRENA